MNKLLLFTLIISACYGQIPWDFTNCGNESDNLTVTGVVLSAAPQRLVSENISIIGFSKAHGDVAQVRIDIYLNGRKVISENQAFVQTLDLHQTFFFKYSYYISGMAPYGNYSISFAFLNSKQVFQGCTSIKMSL